MTTYIIPAGKNDHTVTVNGNMMTGDTYQVKDIIKQFFGGKWDSERRAWVINLNDIQRWMGIKIKPTTTPLKQSKTSYTPTHWRNPDGSLGADF